MQKPNCSMALLCRMTMAIILTVPLLIQPAFASPETDYQNNLLHQAELKEQMTGNQSTINTLASDRAQLQTEYDAIQLQVDEYQTQVDDLDAEILT
ncbi:MAG: hypothetical protein RSB25_20025, partial [Acinetobacter sp.]